METYWDKRFLEEGHVWGDEPSRTAVHALDIFRRYPVKDILVPGSGYGRNTRLFSEAGFAVTGIEVSQVAVALAGKHDPLTRHCQGSVLDMSFDHNRYDAIYCFNVIHLFRGKDRELCLRECVSKLRDNGLMFFTAFNTADPGFGKGKEVEPDTFESKPGRPAHYFTEDDLRRLFRDFEVLESGVAEEPEDHGEGPHVHRLTCILTRKLAE